jgi:hypothetical protein
MIDDNYLENMDWCSWEGPELFTLTIIENGYKSDQKWVRRSKIYL